VHCGADRPLLPAVPEGAQAPRNGGRHWRLLELALGAPDGHQMGWDRAPTRISSWPTFIKGLEEFAHLEHNKHEKIGETFGMMQLNWAKYWSEWQDLNLRPPRPERGAPLSSSENSALFDCVRGRLLLFVLYPDSGLVGRRPRHLLHRVLVKVRVVMPIAPAATFRASCGGSPANAPQVGSILHHPACYGLVRAMRREAGAEHTARKAREHRGHRFLPLNLNS
jgi:hypothetical protein